MAGITSIGISSGVLTSDLIDKIVAAEREPTERRLDSKEELISAKLSGYGQIKSALSDLRLETRVLSTASTLNKLTGTSTDTALSATVDSTASPGSYTFEVSQLAQAHALSSVAFATETEAVGTGTLNVTVGTETVALTIDSGNNTLQGIADEINAQSTLAVNANVIYDGANYKLVLSSQNAGLANDIELTVTGDGDTNDTDANGLSRLYYDATYQNMVQTVEAKDSNFKVNGVDITRSSNSVNDVITGVTLNFGGTNAGSPGTLTVGQDTATMVSDFSDFVDKFNDLQTLYNELTEFDPETFEAEVLSGDTTLRYVFDTIKNNIHLLMPGLETVEVNSLVDLGISTNKDTGLISFNETTFKNALSAYPADFEALLSVQGRASDSQIEFENHLSFSEAGTYAVNISTMATQGALTGAVYTPATTIVAASNDTFAIKVDGVQSGTITLAAGTYSGDALAAEIESQINADATLVAAGKNVSVDFTAGLEQQITSNSYGTTSTVEITSASSADYGFSVASGTAGVNVAGTINGKAATGSGQSLTAGDASGAEGVTIKVKGGIIGDRGTATLIRGIGDRIVSSINDFLGIQGAITTRETGLSETLTDIAEERLDLDERLEFLQSRLATQFTAADILIGNLNSTGDFLTNFFKSLTPSNE